MKEERLRFKLTHYLDAVSVDFEELLRKIELVKDQVGLALITDKGVETVEFFDMAASWEAIHKDAVTRLGTAVAAKDKDNVFEYKKEKAAVAVRSVLAREYKVETIYEHRRENGDPAIHVMSLKGDGYVGEVVELDGVAIHAVILKVA